MRYVLRSSVAEFGVQGEGGEGVGRDREGEGGVNHGVSTPLI